MPDPSQIEKIEEHGLITIITPDEYLGSMRKNLSGQRGIQTNLSRKEAVYHMTYH